MKEPKLPPDTEQYYYSAEAIYDHYKTVKVIDRCECCNHKIGEHTFEKGVKIIGWKVKRYKKDVWWSINKATKKIVEDNVFKVSPILDMLKGKKEK